MCRQVVKWGETWDFFHACPFQFVRSTRTAVLPVDLVPFLRLSRSAPKITIVPERWKPLASR